VVVSVTAISLSDEGRPHTAVRCGFLCRSDLGLEHGPQLFELGGRVTGTGPGCAKVKADRARRVGRSWRR
jgi:hypothetical protein